ncbi:MAG: class I SAM-dependent methyltransferase [Methanobacterium sp.]
MEKVKNHFEEEAKEFDSLILKLIPHYDEMISSLTLAIPFNVKETIKILDLGCGTGNVSLAVKERFPRSKLTCVDLAENMIEMARTKLFKYSDIEYQIGNFSTLNFSDNYDVIFSSLALHHLKSDEEKKGLYSKIYDALSVGGVFYNADTVLGSNSHLSKVNMDMWKNYMMKNLPLDEIEEKWLPTHYEEDFPAPLMDQLGWLSEIGFKEVDVVWKYYQGAVYGGLK